MRSDKYHLASSNENGDWGDWTEEKAEAEMAGELFEKELFAHNRGAQDRVKCRSMIAVCDPEDAWTSNMQCVTRYREFL